MIRVGDRVQLIAGFGVAPELNYAFGEVISVTYGRVLVEFADERDEWVLDGWLVVQSAVDRLAELLRD